jgi:protocatechuate 3,4-dioxygenase beta subunit
MTSDALAKVLSGLFVLVVLTPSVFAQTETGQITGTIKDPAGASVPHAIVKVTSVGTGMERSATTSNDGTYAVTNLLPGEYTVTVSAPGVLPAE